MSDNMALKLFPWLSTIISRLAKEKTVFSLQWPPVRYFACLLNENALCPCRVIMYVTLTDIQNGELVYLTRSLSGELEVALCKQLTYYHLWHYIRGTERVSNEHTTMLVPDGYYNAHELDEEVFKPLGAKLHLDTYTGLLQLITTNDKIVISSELAKVLGFSQNTFDAEKMLLTNVRPDPAKHTPLTSHTGWPSIGRSTFTLLN